jgi:hypothetical protein
MKLATRVNLIIRRVHLYSGLFLLPWVLMYGVTGAMFNHLGLFPRIQIQPVNSQTATEAGLSEFPEADKLAAQIVEAIQKDAGSSRVRLTDLPHAEFTNEMSFEVKQDGLQHVVYMDPVTHDSWVGTMPKNEEDPEVLLPAIRNIRLTPDPQDTAKKAAASLLDGAGLLNGKEPQPFGWTKLNFMATVDGQPARITYVLKDGHVDINRYTGEDGMPLRHFFLRMHTSHGQPPSWNGKMFWSLAVDTMAVAMVFWGISGIIMWWQSKRTRWIGAVIIGLSLLTAGAMAMGLHDFYASTRL